nr:serine/threonine-protein phosphatase [Streptomyces sp. NBC_00886]
MWRRCCCTRSGPSRCSGRSPAFRWASTPWPPEPRTVEWFVFPSDGTLLLCTDGVTEARDPSGAFYPLEERAAARGEVLPKDVPATVYGDLRRHTAGTLPDDTALLVLRRRGDAGLL